MVAGGLVKTADPPTMAKTGKDRQTAERRSDRGSRCPANGAAVQLLFACGNVREPRKSQ
jgi:hypothetical protein